MKFFKAGLLLCLAEILAIDSKSQNLDFKKDVVKSIDDLNITLSFDDRNAVAKELIRIDAHGQSDEVLVHQFGKIKITVKHGQNKSELISLTNSTQASIPFSQDQSVTPIDSDGNLISEWTVDLAGNEFGFWSSALKAIASYTPFKEGYKEARFGYSDKLVGFYSVSEQPPIISKLGLTDHVGNLIAERELNEVGYGISDLKIMGKQVFLLLNEYTSAQSKVLAFDGSLNLLWERNWLEGISGYSIKVDEASKSILVITQKTIVCINADGTTRWELSNDDFYGNAGGKSFAHAYLMGGRYMVIVVSQYIDGKYLDNKAIVIDSEKGEKKFERHLGEYKSRPLVFGGKEGFVLVGDNQIFSYYAK